MCPVFGGAPWLEMGRGRKARFLGSAALRLERQQRRGADRGRGWQVLAMASLPEMQSVHAVLAVRATLAGMGERRRLGGGPVLGEDFGLFEDCLGGFFLLVGWVAVLAEDAAD